MEAIVGSIYRPTKKIVLYKHFGRAQGAYDAGIDDLIIDETASIMYVDIELYSWGGDQCYMCIVLYDNKKWYLLESRHVKRIG